MPGPTNANVQSISAVSDVRVAVLSFVERVNSALDDLRSKIDRTMAWLEQDRPLYWREQERRAYDRVASTRVAYETCRMRTVGGRHSECIEEKIAHQRAKERLEFCKDKMELVRKWCAEASRQVDEYRGRTSPLKSMLDEDTPNLVAKLSRMIEALEAYAGLGMSTPTEVSVSLGTDDARVASQPTLQTDAQNTEPNGVGSRPDSAHLKNPSDGPIGEPRTS
jgi:hypothetical protein